MIDLFSRQVSVQVDVIVHHDRIIRKVVAAHATEELEYAVVVGEVEHGIEQALDLLLARHARAQVARQRLELPVRLLAKLHDAPDAVKKRLKNLMVDIQIASHLITRRLPVSVKYRRWPFLYLFTKMESHHWSTE